MKTFLVTLLAWSFAQAGLNPRFEQPHKQVNSYCNIKLTRLNQNKWEPYHEQRFQLVSSQSNFTEVPLRIDDADFKLFYAYNAKGKAYNNYDPRLEESVNFRLVEKESGEKRAYGHFAALEDQEVPTQFYLHDSLKVNETPYIIHLICSTEKILKG